MGVSRRSVLMSAAVGVGLGATGVLAALPTEMASAASPVGDVVGKIIRRLPGLVRLYR